VVAIKLSAYGGMIPATDDRLLPENNAALAQNTWLYPGSIRGIIAPKLLHTFDNPTAKKALRIPMGEPDRNHIVDSYFIEFLESDIDIVEAPLADDSFERYYFATPGSVPRYNTKQRLIDGDPLYTLGIPTPATAPTVTLGPGSVDFEPGYGVYGITGMPATLRYGSTTGVRQDNTGTTPTYPGLSTPASSNNVVVTRSYVYTWVSLYGEEGPPSPPTLETGQQGNVWHLTLTAPTIDDTTNRALDKTRIYRTVTSSAGVATYFLVAEIDIGTLTYDDETTDLEVTANNQLESTGWVAPPTDLQGIVALPNGIVAGWREREIYFCEPYRPHAWPVAYALSVESEIVGLGVVAQTLVICTRSSPYSATGVNPAAMALNKISSVQPCVSRPSIVSSDEGVYYASPSGLVLVAQGTAQVITRKMATKDKWSMLLDISSLRAVRMDTAYYAWGSVKSGCFEPTAFENPAFELNDFTGSRDGALIDLLDGRVAWTALYNEDPLVNMFLDPLTSEVMLVRDGKLYWLDLTDDSTGYEAYIWRSKVFQPSERKNLEAMKIFFDLPSGVTEPGTVRVYADGRMVLERAIPTLSGQMFRLPSGFKATFWQIEVESHATIYSIETATSAKELRNV
jgi:hypothetical protein